MLVRHVSRVLAALAAVALLPGCANRESPINKRPHSGTAVASDIGGIQQVVIRSGLDLRFHPSTIIVHPGRVRIVLVNTANPGAGPPHDLQVHDVPRADVPLATAGQVQSVTFTAPAPGTYSFICSIHVNQGQTGKMIVR